MGCFIFSFFSVLLYPQKRDWPMRFLYGKGTSLFQVLFNSCSSSILLVFQSRTLCIRFPSISLTPYLHPLLPGEGKRANRNTLFPSPEWFVEQRPREDKNKMLYPMLRSFNKERSPFPGKVRCAKTKEKNYFIKNILLYIIPRTNSSSNRILYLLPQDENRTYNSPFSSTISVMVTQW